MFTLSIRFKAGSSSLSSISFNQLTTLPDTICKLKRLVTLNVSNNKLNQLPNNIGHLDELSDFVSSLPLLDDSDWTSC